MRHLVHRAIPESDPLVGIGIVGIGARVVVPGGDMDNGSLGQHRGGFVGVDIFFVISGFLITGLIYGDIQRGDYSVVGFYVRRARRIFPALFFTCAVCAAVLTVVYLPTEVAQFKNSLVAATLFVSNIYFYLTEDYFGGGADTKPLLHTWSLAVEEQFYIFFPLMLLALHRYCAK